MFKILRGTDAHRLGLTLAEGEQFYTTDTKLYYIGDGVTVGGNLMSGSGTGTVTSVDMSVPVGFAIAGNPITVSGILALTFDTGYSLPTTSKQGDWDTAFGWGNHASAGYLTAAAAASTYVPQTTTLTINGVAQDLSTNRSWTVTMPDADYGDITVSGAGTVMTIDNLAVTNAKINDVAWGKITGTPTTLAGYGITDAQPLDADLTAISALTGTSGFLKTDGAGIWSVDTNTYLTSYTETDPVFLASDAAGITATDISNWDTAYGWGDHSAAGYVTLTNRNYQQSLTTGVLSGGVVTINGVDNTKIDISAGTGIIVDDWTDPQNPTTYNVSWGAQSSLAVTYLLSNTFSYIYIDNTGAIFQDNAAPTGAERRDYILLARLGHTNLTTVNSVVNRYQVAHSPIAQFRDFASFVEPVNSGNVISPNGANLSINKTAGKIFNLGGNYPTDAKEPHVVTVASATAPSLRLRTQTGNGSTSTTLDVANYDNAGTITATGANKFTNQRVYLFPNGNIVVQYGQTVYNTMAAASAGLATESFVKFINVEDAILIGVITVKSTATDLSDPVEAEFHYASKFGEVGLSGAGSTTAVFQNIYDNSTTPEILTDATRLALTIQVGSGANTDNVFEGKNIAGTTTFSVNGNGAITTGIWNGTAIDDSYISSASNWNAAYAFTSAITATTGEVNLLDLSGLTAGWVLAADTASTASWRKLLGSEITNDAGWISGNQTITLSGDVTGSGTTAITTTITDNVSIQQVEIVKNSGAVVGTRKQLNFIEGSNVTLTIADDAGNDQVDITIASSGGVGTHLLLDSTIHTDTTTGTVTRGDLIVGQGVSASWTRLAIGGAATYLRSDGTDATWAAISWSDVGSTPTTLAGYGITDAQPLDSDLTAIAALTGTSGFLKTDGAGIWSVDTNSYSLSGHTHTLSEVTDVTATVAEVNLLDLSGLTAGWVLAADTASTASWRQLLGSEINNDLGWLTAVTAAGSSTQIQYNTSNALDASADFTFNNTTKRLTIGASGGSINLSTADDLTVGYKIGDAFLVRYQATLKNFWFNPANPAALTTAHDNFFAGVSSGLNEFSGQDIISGNYNVGINGLNNVTTGSNNVALGSGTLNANTTGSNNVAIGFDSLNNTSTGSTYNIAIGSETGQGIGNSDSHNIAFGYRALFTSSADSNIAIGQMALRDGANGRNVVIGDNAARSSSTNTHYNAIVGAYAAVSFTGRYSAIYGGEAAQGSGNVDGLTAIGYQSLFSNSTGVNTALGYRTLYNNVGTGNVAIGFDAGFSETTLSNGLIIANGSAAANELIRGDFSTGIVSIKSKLGVGVAVASVTAQSHFAAHSTAAGSAPIKLTSGTAMTTPEDGAFEYHSSHLYFTIGSTRYQLDQQAGAASPLTTKGDIWVYGAADDRLPVGTDGYALFSDSTQPLGVKWAAVTGGSGDSTFRDATPDSGSYGALGGTVNGSNTTFTVSEGSYVSGTLKVWLNGQLMNQGASYDWQETTPASGTFDFNVAPATGDQIVVEYATSTGSPTAPISVSTYTTTTVNITATSGRHFILIDAATAGGNVTVNLPTAVGNTAEFIIKKIDSGSNTVTVDGATTETIDGQTTQTILFQNTVFSIASDNSNWWRTN